MHGNLDFRSSISNHITADSEEEFILWNPPLSQDSADAARQNATDRYAYPYAVFVPRPNDMYEDVLWHNRLDFQQFHDMNRYVKSECSSITIVVFLLFYK